MLAGGSVTSHKMKLLIIPFPPKKVRNMVRIKLTSDLSLGDLCALRENSARDTQNIVKHYEKGRHLSPGFGYGNIPTTPVKLMGSVTPL